MAGRSLGEAPSRRLTRTQTVGNLAANEAIDSEVVPSTLSKIAPILRVANEIESECPRVAYLCRFYAFEKAHKDDPTSSGRGVRQFKTALLQRLEKDAEATLKARKKKAMLEKCKAFISNTMNNISSHSMQHLKKQIGHSWQKHIKLLQCCLKY